MNDGTVGAGDEVVSGEIFSLSAHVVLVRFEFGLLRFRVLGLGIFGCALHSDLLACGILKVYQ